jgi:hypothetical protein
MSCLNYPLEMQSFSFRLPCHNGRVTLHEVLVQNLSSMVNFCAMAALHCPV